MSRPTHVRKPRLSSGARLLLAVLMTTVIVGAVSIGVVTAAVYRAGTVDLEVVEPDGGRVSLCVPGALVHAGVRLVPADLLAEAAGEVEPWWPAVRAAWEGLEDCDDVALIEVDGPHEKVRISKRGGMLVIDVEDHGARVHVAVPVGTVSLVIDRIDRALDV